MSEEPNRPVERPSDQPYVPAIEGPTEHPTGQRQAAENVENDPPA